MKQTQIADRSQTSAMEAANATVAEYGDIINMVAGRAASWRAGKAQLEAEVVRLRSRVAELETENSEMRKKLDVPSEQKVDDDK